MILSMVPRFFRRISPLLLAVGIVLWAGILVAQGKPEASPRPSPRLVPPRPPLSPETTVTFTREVARILQTSCQTCHREKGIAPFPLMTYGDAYARRFQIADQTARRKMPPWHASSDCAEYQRNPSLTEEQIAIFGRWLAAGAPEGDPRDLPPPLTFSDGWTLGQPDQVLTMPEPMTPDFSRGDVYRCFVLPTGLSEDRYVSASEVVPGAAGMVHHVILFLDTTGVSEQLDREEPGPGYTCFGGPGFSMVSALGGWAPGNSPAFLPEGIGIPLPKNSRVVMQVHYSAHSGLSAPDRTSVGLYFAKPPVRKRLLIAPVINTSFFIPAGASDYEVTASIPFLPFGVHLYSITPHMHLLGTKMTVRATLPDGRRRCLVEIPDWDFHWQRTYDFKTPVALPFGSRVDLSARYDNSAANPRNPSNPPRDVSWGENTTDEMCIAFLGATLDSENLGMSEYEPAGGLAAPAPEDAGADRRVSETGSPFEVDWPVSPRQPAVPRR